nr:MAG TPA: cysteine-rich protein [Bacteriophage sp.]
MGEMTKTSVKYCRKCKYAYKHTRQKSCVDIIYRPD